MRTTIGQLLVNNALPEDMRDFKRTLDKKTLRALLSDLAKQHPDDYRDVSHKLSQLGHQAAYTTGGNSFGLQHLRKAKSAQAIQQKLRQELIGILADESLTDDERDKALIEATGKYSQEQQKAVYEEALAENNPLARQVASGSRGNPMNLASLLGGDLLYTDHRDRVLPIPVLRSYSEGLSPLEYWAGTYGARKGVADTKFATRDAGFLSKQLNAIAHRSIVSGLDYDELPAGAAPRPLRGLPVSVDDAESEGSLLAHDIGGYPRNTVLTPKILADLKSKGVPRILVRSPAVGGPSDGGVFARDVGVREFGRLPYAGENVGMTAAQAMSEPLSQAQLSSKHSGGVAGAESGAAVSGFDRINQLVQVPKQMKGGGAHADADGLVQKIEDGPAGGKYVWIENKRHYVANGLNLKVKKGDHVEAGDMISDGLPNPALVVKHKGVGEGRRYFMNAFRQAFIDAGIKAHRRNIELIAKNLVNHVRLQDEVGDFAPDDIVPYSRLEASWKPRPGHYLTEPKRATGKYLEQPYLHYAIGDKVRPSMLRDFDEFGIKQIDVHDEEPPFQPEMVRGMSNLQYDPDWLTRAFGSGQRKSILNAVHRGGSSTELGTSFVPGLARGVDFGTQGRVRTPQAGVYSFQDIAKKAASVRTKLAETTQEQAIRQLYEQTLWAQRMQQQYYDNMLMEQALSPSAAAEQSKFIASAPMQILSRYAGAETPLWVVDTVSGGQIPLTQSSLGERFRQLAATSGIPRPELNSSYLLPGNGTYIDQYNAALSSGRQPSPDVATLAFNEMNQNASPEQAAMINQTLAPEFQQEQLSAIDQQARSEQAQTLQQRYLQLMGTQQPDAFRSYNTAGRAMDLVPGFDPVRRYQAELQRLSLDYRKGKIRDMRELRAEMDDLAAQAGLDPQGWVSDQDLAAITDIGNSPEYHQMRQDVKQQYAPYLMTPEQQQQQQLNQQWQQENQQWLASQGVAQGSQPYDEAKAEEARQLFRQTLQQTGQTQFSQADAALMGQVADAYATGGISREQVAASLQSYQPILQQRVSTWNGQPAATQLATQPAPQPTSQAPTQVAQSPAAPPVSPRAGLASPPRNLTSLAPTAASKPPAGLNTMSTVMQGLFAMNPGAVSRGIQATGPLGFGLLGLMADPQSVATLTQGPGPQKTPDTKLPKLQQPAQPMKPQQPAMPSGSVGKPPRVPSPAPTPDVPG